MIGIPLRDNNPTVRTPFFTYTFLVVNVAVYLYQLTLHERAAYFFVQSHGAIPAQIIHFQNLPSLLTSMFVHGGLLHLLGNMLYLHIFGDNIEDLLGHVKFVGFYFLCGFGAVFSHIIIDPSSQIPMVGASGAISGVLGAYLVSYPRARVQVAVPIFIYIFKTFWIPSIIVLGIWFLLQILFGLASIGAAGGGGVAWFAHIGGFIVGIILVKIAKPQKQQFYNNFDEEEKW
ncbi:MAG: rhomboid family intramembrane serine protease [bacterium]